jgi:hypothetical protein
MTIQQCAVHNLRYEDTEGACPTCEFYASGAADPYEDEPEFCECPIAHDESEEASGICGACGGLVVGDSGQ